MCSISLNAFKVETTGIHGILLPTKMGKGGGKGGNKVFATGVGVGLGGGGSPSPTGQKSTRSSPNRKINPSRLIPEFLFPTLKVYSPTKYEFSRYNPIKTLFLAAVIAPISFLSYLHTLCTHRSF